MESPRAARVEKIVAALLKFRKIMDTNLATGEAYPLNIETSVIRKYPPTRPHLDFGRSPLNLLVATMLSAQCTDRMVNKVTPRLFKRYKNAQDYANADARALMKEIRSIGLYRSKARNIKKMALMLIKDFKGRVPDSIDRLVLLPGVGRKTANIVLANAFKKSEGIAVDTHVRRISKRLRLTNKDTPDKIEIDLMKVVPRRRWGVFNHLLVAHGRAVCRARNPLHSICVIRNYCRWYKLHLRGGAAVGGHSS